MPFSANAPAYSGRPSLLSQSAISCITAHARLNFGLVDPLDGGFYPIDRAARNLPERSAAGVTGGPPRRAIDGSRPRVHRDANVLEVLIGMPFSACAGVLGEAEPCEPIGFLHRRPRPAKCGLVDPLDGRFYPIDRAARNLPERSAAG
jgi:hypothetical protein